MRINRLLAAIAISALALPLSACGDSSDTINGHVVTSACADPIRLTLTDSEGTKLASTVTGSENIVAPVTSPCVTTFKFEDVPESDVYTLTSSEGEVELSYGELEDNDFLWTIGTPLPEPSSDALCDLGERAMETLRNATPSSSSEKQTWNWEVHAYQEELLTYAATWILDGQKEKGERAHAAAAPFLMILANGGPVGDVDDLNDSAQKILDTFGPVYSDAGCGTFRVPTYTDVETGTAWDLD